MSQRFVPFAPTCPHCSALLDGASAADGVDSRGPEPGDPTICAYCAEPSVFDGSPVQLRIATAEELELFNAYPEFVQGLTYFRQMRAAGQLPSAPVRVTH